MHQVFFPCISSIDASIYLCTHARIMYSACTIRRPVPTLSASQRNVYGANIALVDVCIFAVTFIRSSIWRFTPCIMRINRAGIDIFDDCCSTAWCNPAKSVEKLISLSLSVSLSFFSRLLRVTAFLGCISVYETLRLGEFTMENWLKAVFRHDQWSGQVHM